MLVYLMLIVICLICGILIDRLKINNESEKKYFKIIFTIPFFCLFLISGIRYGVGKDYFGTYVYTFERILNNYSNIRIDPGFYLLNKIVILFGGSFQWIFIITSFIINYFICKSIYDQSKNKMLSLFIYVCGTLYFFSMNGIRQTIALSLFYYSLKYIKDRNFAKYIFINLIALTIHNSAIIFFPLYFILNKNFSKKFKIFSILIIFLSIPIILPVITNFLLNTKYAIYIVNGAYKPLDFINVSTILNILLYLAYELKIKDNDKDKYDIIYSNMHFIGVIVSIFVTRIPLAMRIFIYFRFIEFLSVPNLIDKVKLKRSNKIIIRFTVIVLYFIYFIHGVYIENGNNVLPYKTYFER